MHLFFFLDRLLCSDWIRVFFVVPDIIQLSCPRWSEERLIIEVNLTLTIRFGSIYSYYCIHSISIELEKYIYISSSLIPHNPRHAKLHFWSRAIVWLRKLDTRCLVQRAQLPTFRAISSMIIFSYHHDISEETEWKHFEIYVKKILRTLLDTSYFWDGDRYLEDGLSRKQRMKIVEKDSLREVFISFFFEYDVGRPRKWHDI